MTTDTTTDTDTGQLAQLLTLAEECDLDNADFYEVVHDLASDHASEVNNDGLGAQLQYMQTAHGTETAEQIVRTVAVAKLDTLLGQLSSACADLCSHLPHPLPGAASWREACTSFEGALAGMYRILSALDEPDLRALTLGFLNSFTPARLEEGYRERADLAAIITKQQAVLAAAGAATPAILVDPRPTDPDPYPVLYFDLPADNDGFGILGQDRQITIHVHPDDLPKFDHVQRVSADDPAAPAWDKTGKSGYRHRIRIYTTTPVTGSDPTEPAAAAH
ncbi:hypothetical protein [Nocardia sp. XZ_19_369]|uniref:hypothetical protein n=1 Tax=Nocardia sp. XZ_19_369 TaxID=2769487 RepID=UPI001890462A|nr:hypothetical protein [Nocardia sp. XZ_19_369]